MTGLDVDNDTILEIACFCTDHDLNLLDAKGFEAVVHHNQEALDSMNDWCKEHHGKSGLSSAVLKSQTSPEQAADSLLNYIRQHIPEARKALLAGNTVHMDKAFLRKAPYDRVIDHLGYRILDVSALKEAARRWAPAEILQKSPQKKGSHQAREDIIESIEEAKFYRDTFFKK